MSDYVITIGGSGARSLEALVFLCAAGLGPSKFSLVCVDPDRNNGNLKRTLRLIKAYEVLAGENSVPGLFGSRLELLAPAVWSPFENSAVSPTLENYFDYQALKIREPGVASLFDMLYSPEQQRATLDIGFRGKPSIGAGVFATKVGLITEEPWRSIRTSIGNDASSGQNVRLFAIGSIFGGTGAAGLPTIPRILVQGIASAQAKVAVGAALVLPYFTFNPSANVADGEVYAKSDAFLLNAKEALRYYEESGGEYNRLYLLGLDHPSVNKSFSIGGDTQENRPHLVDLLAGLAALDFAETGKPDQSQVVMTARAKDNKFEWNDLPGGHRVSSHLRHLTRFSFAFLRIFQPVLQAIARGDRCAARTPWYVDLLRLQGVDVSANDVRTKLERLREFCQAYLTWFSQLCQQSSSGGAFEMRLVDGTAFPKPESPETFQDDRFATMTFEPALNSNSLAEVWLRACEPGSAKPVGTDPITHFIRALHHASR